MTHTYTQAGKHTSPDKHPPTDARALTRAHTQTRTHTPLILAGVDLKAEYFDVSVSFPANEQSL